MRKVVMLGLALLGLSLALLGCGGTASCGPANCAGCCSAAGVCNAGADLSFCGSGGAACNTCVLGQSCTAGLCQAAQTGCGPGNCEYGCCSGDTCVDGLASTACGIGGRACSVCPAGQSCSMWLCEAPTSGCMQTCAGCCVGNTCNPGNTTSACGASGAACATCTSSQYCEAGSCKASCTSIDGCPFGSDICVSNRCVTGYGRTYTVTAVSAVIPTTDSTGASWDALGGAPDPFVCLYLDGSSTAVSCSGPPGVADTFTPTWNKSWDITVNQTTKVTLWAWDEDTTAHDAIEGFEWANGTGFVVATRAGGFSGIVSGGRVNWNITITPKP